MREHVGVVVILLLGHVLVHWPHAFVAVNVAAQVQVNTVGIKQVLDLLAQVFRHIGPHNVVRGLGCGRVLRVASHTPMNHNNKPKSQEAYTRHYERKGFKAGQSPQMDGRRINHNQRSEV
jgi:hypothetical protein